MGLVSRLRNVRITRKLSAGFGIVLLLVALATGLSVQRFNAIHDIYQKTNLIYDINIEVFQAKINRLKYLYGDDKSGQVMANYVTHAQQLNNEAKQLSWGDDTRQLVDQLGTHLASFQNSIGAMTQATQQLNSLRSQLDSLSQQDMTARYTQLIRTPVTNPDITNQIYQQLFAISNVREEAWALRFNVTDALRKTLETHFQQADQGMKALLAQLPPEQQGEFNAVWQDTEKFKSLSLQAADAYGQLRAAEDTVKVAGDNSSAAIKKIITIVKARNDELANGSAAISLLIGGLAILFGILVAWYIIRQITRPVFHNLALAERIASGDLSSQFATDRHDELGKLTSAMGRMNERLRSMIGDVLSSVSSVSQAASAINQGNLDLSSRTEQQAAAVVETAASMEQLTATVKNNAANARQASQIAAEASHNANQGGIAVRDVVNTMGEISDSSKKIADITAVINSIAFQTNILALNAAVEAARAGEQGRGFAVVASEVRNLAQRSAGAAKDIEQLISESVGRISNGHQQVARAGETMEQIVNSIARVNGIMEEISAASDEQSRGIEQIARAVGELDTTTQQNATLVSASSHSANSLEEQAMMLERLVAQFRLQGATR
ncbi:methyl-accepting chemotaxis protein [Pantoea sp.]|uniref:methyl-accepting chemotaxis protein n=1 Tax=Pantoea sp. TaxID=69393 RepID=UPI0031DDFF93